MPFHQTLFDRISEGGNRLFGAPQGLLSPEEQQFAQQQGLLGLGSSLLRASGPSRDPIGLGQAIGEAIPQGQAAAFQGLQTQDFLQQRQAAQQEAQAAQQAAQAQQQALQQAGQLLQGDDPDYPGAIRTMLQAGLTDEALKLSQAAENLRGDPIKTVTDAAGNVYALDPQTGDILNKIGVEFGGEVVQLNPEQFRQVDTVRDDLVREGGSQLQQAASFGGIKAAADDMKAAIQTNDRSAATAASSSIVNAFARLIDPGSLTVRDPEFNRIMRLGSLEERITGLADRFLSGTISVDVLNSIVRQAEFQLRSARQQYRDVFVKSAQDRLEKIGIPKRFLSEPDPFRLFEQSTTTGIPEPFVPPRTFKPSFGERLVGGFRPDRSPSQELVDLVTESVRDRFERLGRERRAGGGALNRQRERDRGR